jgi:hypothetical protein
VNLKWLADYCGTSVAMIEQHYGRFAAGQAEAQLALLAGLSMPGAERREAAAVGATQPSTFDPRLTVAAKKPLWNQASPTGFELHSPEPSKEPKSAAKSPESSLSALSDVTTVDPRMSRDFPPRPAKTATIAVRKRGRSR